MTELDMTAPVKGIKVFAGNLHRRRIGAAQLTVAMQETLGPLLDGIKVHRPLAAAARASLEVVQVAVAPATQSQGHKPTPSLAKLQITQQARQKKPGTAPGAGR